MRSSHEAHNFDQLKSCFFITEALFAFVDEEVQTQVLNDCVGELFKIMDHDLMAMNTDVLALNNQLT